MDALVLLREQAERTDSLLTQVFAPVTVEQAIWRAESSTANPIAALFLHVYHTEDGLVQGRLQAKPTIFASGRWQERLGYDPSSPWSPISQPDLTAFRAYVAEVRAATAQFLANLDPDALEREVPGPRGPRPMVTGLSLLLVTHKSGHMGEISALLGCQGVKGFPF